MDKVSNGAKQHGKASTLQVLGTAAPGTKRIRREWAEHHRVLTDLKERLAADREASTDVAKMEIPTFSLHMAEAATDSYDRDYALATLSSSQSLLYEIDEALNRIANGSYGVCEETGEPIAAERLKAIPWTRFSAEAQAELEARGQVQRARLGDLGSYSQLSLEAPASEETEEESATPAGRKNE